MNDLAVFVSTINPLDDNNPPSIPPPPSSLPQKSPGAKTDSNLQTQTVSESASMSEDEDEFHIASEGSVFGYGSSMFQSKLGKSILHKSLNISPQTNAATAPIGTSATAPSSSLPESPSLARNFCDLSISLSVDECNAHRKSHYGDCIAACLIYSFFSSDFLCIRE